MEEKNNIDQLFRQGLNQNFPVDTNLWGQVESQIPPIKSGRKGFWIFNLNSLLVVGLLSISMLLNSDNSIPSSIELEDSEYINAIKKENNLITQQSTIIADKSEQKTTDLLDSDINNLKTSLANNVNPDNISTKSVFNQSINTGNTSVIKENIKTITPSITKESFINHSEKKQSVLSLNLTTSKVIYNQLEMLPLLPYNKMRSEINSSPIKNNKSWKSIRAPYYYYEIEINRSLGANKVLRDLESNVKEYKKQNERTSTISNVGLNIFTDHKSLQLGIGLHFSKYSENLNYLVDAPGVAYDINYDTTYKVVNGNFNSNGVPVLLIERNIEETVTERGVIVKKEVYLRNEFERLQIPIFLGIHKNIGRFYGNIRTSLNLNYSIQQTGAYIENDLNKIQNFEAKNQINQFVIGNTSSASLGYSLNEFIVIGTRFNYETDLTSFTKGYNSRFNQYGLGLWLMWKPR